MGHGHGLHHDPLLKDRGLTSQLGPKNCKPDPGEGPCSSSARHLHQLSILGNWVRHCYVNRNCIIPKFPFEHCTNSGPLVSHHTPIFIYKTIKIVFWFYSYSIWSRSLQEPYPLPLCLYVVRQNHSQYLRSKLLGRIEQFQFSNYFAVWAFQNWKEAQYVSKWAQFGDLIIPSCGFPSGDPEIVFQWMNSGLSRLLNTKFYLTGKIYVPWVA